MGSCQNIAGKILNLKCKMNLKISSTTFVFKNVTMQKKKNATNNKWNQHPKQQLNTQTHTHTPLPLLCISPLAVLVAPLAVFSCISLF